MAIFHLRAQVISRSSGRSAPAAAAYRSASRLADGNQVWDYTKRAGVHLAEIHLPSQAPHWMSERPLLWASVEAVEKRCDAQLAREIVIALPLELDLRGKEAVARDFATTLTKAGMVVDLAVHDVHTGNPHAHLMCSTRTIESQSWGRKERGWNSRPFLKWMRTSWRDVCARHGVAIDDRSYAEQGVEKLATVHVGVKSPRRARRGLHSEEEAINAAVLITRDHPESQWLDQLPAAARAAPSALDRYGRLLALGHPVQPLLEAWRRVEADLSGIVEPLPKMPRRMDRA